MPTPLCPSDDELTALLIGRLHESSLAALGTHLDACRVCQQHLQSTDAKLSDTVVVAMRAAANASSYADERTCDLALAHAGALVEQSALPMASETRVDVDAPPRRLREYQLVAKLGEGGMGAVYRALHTRLDKTVAIKVLPSKRMHNPAAVARFEREMKAVGRLDHPHIVRALDAGEEQGAHFLVMEYAPGSDLSRLAQAIGPLPVPAACELIRQAALGLGEIHDHGMVHRDIKPSNLILTQGARKSTQPIVKVLDLGLALFSEALSPDEQGLTSSSQLMGTIDYMAPEQCGNSHQVDIRADIYALGATLYRLLAGDAPFGGAQFDTPLKKLAALATAAPAPIRARRSDVPPLLAEVIHRMLAKDAAQRFQTPDEVVAALAPFCQGADLAALLAPGESRALRADQACNPPAAGAPQSGSDSTCSLRISAPGPKPSATGSKNSAAPGRSWVRRGAWLLSVAAGLILLAAVILLVPSEHGTLRIEINDPAIKVVLDHDGSAAFQGADKQHEIVAKTGAHGLTITRGDFSFETTQFVLNRKGLAALKVQYFPGKIQVADASGAILDERTLPQYALRFDGVDDYIELPTLKFDPAQGYTIELWAEVENAVDSPQLLHFSGAPGQRAKIQLGAPLGPDRPNLLAAVTTANSSVAQPEYAVLRFDDTFSAGVHHIAFCWSPQGEAALYWNGRKCPQPAVLDHTKSWPTGALSLIGANPKSNGEKHLFLKGVVRQVRFSRGVRYAAGFPLSLQWRPDAATLALYRCEEGGGDLLVDSSGNGHHGKIVGARWERLPNAPDPLRPPAAGLVFDGVDDFVELPVLPLPADSPVTLEAWVTPRQLDTDQHEVLVSPTGLGIAFRGDRAIFGMKQSQRLDWQVLESPPVSVQPKHICGVMDGREMRLYVDGRLASRAAKTRETSQPTTPFYLGSMLGEGLFLNGVIHGARVSTTARYHEDFAPPTAWTPDAATLALYRCDEGAGDVLKDSSGKNHHGKIVGAQWSEKTAAPLAINDQGPLRPAARSVLQFNRGIEYVEVGEFPYDPNGPLTVEAWVKLTGLAFAPIVKLRGMPREFVLHRTAPPGGDFGFGMHHPGGTIDHMALVDKPSALVHVSGVWDGQTQALFVDGKKVGKSSQNDKFPTSREAKRGFLLIGGENGPPISLAGQIALVRISKTARYSEDFAPDAAWRTDNDTLALYLCDEGQGDILKDSSGNERHGKIVGAKWGRVNWELPARSSGARLQTP